MRHVTRLWKSGPVLPPEGQKERKTDQQTDRQTEREKREEEEKCLTVTS